MTDDEAKELRQLVENHFSGCRGPGFDIGNPQHFEQVVASRRAHVGTMADDDLRVVLAMCLLGPGDMPPAAMRAELLHIVQERVPCEAERLGRIMEFAIAYGCGKWRPVQPDAHGWQQRWPGAQEALTRAVEPAVEQANRWLAAHVVGFGQERNIPHHRDSAKATDVWSDARLLALRLIRAEQLHALGKGETLHITQTHDSTELQVSSRDYQLPPGAKIVWSVADGHAALELPQGATLALLTGTKVVVTARDEDALVSVAMSPQARRVQLKAGTTAHVRGPATLAMWECTCGTVHCQEQHRLEAWDPKRRVRNHKPLTLWDFVASAVKGPQFVIQTGSFVQGMYFPLLAQEGF